MKRFIQLSALIVFYLVFSAESCDREEGYEASREQKATASAKDSLLSVFGSDTLTFTALAAYEETAKIRFADLFDYLKIYSDTSAAPAFREQARQMAGELFISDHPLPRFPRPDSVWVMQHPEPVNDSLYAGRLGFSPDGSMGFYVVKRDKIFGTDTVRVWVVLLGGDWKNARDRP